MAYLECPDDVFLFSFSRFFPSCSFPCSSILIFRFVSSCIAFLSALSYCWQSYVAHGAVPSS